MTPGPAVLMPTLMPVFVSVFMSVGTHDDVLHLSIVDQSRCVNDISGLFAEARAVDQTAPYVELSYVDTVHGHRRRPLRDRVTGRFASKVDARFPGWEFAGSRPCWDGSGS
ncbi:hypothetical protein Sliba_68280 [Streptomyces nigrescens]|uniref:Uncharacterized protein n=1 Tax=Streptomyces nigrescens TaxID=1920 RepID=A0A640TW64_STRNI|nr:hypothetical protein Sliba_68280 [Streptomyces libani subsp. libani]GGW07771.1 hypothetical protein GCM10010500_77210 [Streptomyces libani subsp. libani]